MGWPATGAAGSTLTSTVMGRSAPGWGSKRNGPHFASVLLRQGSRVVVVVATVVVVEPTEAAARGGGAVVEVVTAPIVVVVAGAFVTGVVVATGRRTVVVVTIGAGAGAVLVVVGSATSGDTSMTVGSPARATMPAPAAMRSPPSSPALRATIPRPTRKATISTAITCRCRPTTRRHAPSAGGPSATFSVESGTHADNPTDAQLWRHSPRRRRSST